MIFRSDKETGSVNQPGFLFSEGWLIRLLVPYQKIGYNGAAKAI